MIQSIILYSSSACSCEVYSYKDTQISDHVFIPSSPIRKEQQIHLQKIVCFFNGLRKDFNVKRVYLIDGQTDRRTHLYANKLFIPEESRGDYLCKFYDVENKN